MLHIGHSHIQIRCLVVELRHRRRCIFLPAWRSEIGDSTRMVATWTARAAAHYGYPAPVTSQVVRVDALGNCDGVYAPMPPRAVNTPYGCGCSPAMEMGNIYVANNPPSAPAFIQSCDPMHGDPSSGLLWRTFPLNRISGVWQFDCRTGRRTYMQPSETTTRFSSLTSTGLSSSLPPQRRVSYFPVLVPRGVYGSFTSVWGLISSCGSGPLRSRPSG